VQYATTAEIARELRIGEKAIRRMVRDGRLPALRLGRSLRFDRKEVLACLSSVHGDRVVAGSRVR